MRRTRAATGLAVAVVAVAALALIIVLVAAGGSSRRRVSGPFAWLRPTAPPAGWRVVRIPDGAALSYPPEWTAIKTDPGTASAALRGRDGRIDGYVNATPRQGTETLANWSSFRPQKNRAEGARGVRLLASTRNADFRSGRASCVIDAYTTSVATYREIACLISGPRSSAVVVAAAPRRLWQQSAAVLERAVSSFVA